MRAEDLEIHNMARQLSHSSIYGGSGQRLGATRRDYGADAAASQSIEPAVKFTFRSRPCQCFSLSSRRRIFPVAVRGKASMN
jgi:hypothetical protein